jgi:hypothetical protein
MKRHATLPLSLRLIGSYCVPGDWNRSVLEDALRASDAEAAELLTASRGAPLWDYAHPPTTNKEYEVTVSEALRRIAHSFDVSKDPCTAPDEAACEIVEEIQREHNEAGFLLGLCVAARLLGAVNDGSSHGQRKGGAR